MSFAQSEKNLLSRMTLPSRSKPTSHATVAALRGWLKTNPKGPTTQYAWFLEPETSNICYSDPLGKLPRPGAGSFFFLLQRFRFNSMYIAKRLVFLILPTIRDCRGIAECFLPRFFNRSVSRSADLRQPVRESCKNQR